MMMSTKYSHPFLLSCSLRTSSKKHVGQLMQCALCKVQNWPMMMSTKYDKSSLPSELFFNFRTSRKNHIGKLKMAANDASIITDCCLNARCSIYKSNNLTVDAYNISVFCPLPSFAVVIQIPKNSLLSNGDLDIWPFDPIWYSTLALIGPLNYPCTATFIQIP